MSELRQKAHAMIDTLSEQELSYIMGVIKTNNNDISARLKIAQSLYGIIPANMTMEEARLERLNNI